MAPQSKNGLDLSKPVGTKPSPRDVVIFRGGGTNHHPGSKLWRQMVDERKMDYIYAKTQKQKRAIVQDCINAHQANGGRYVGEYEGMFYLATPKKRYAKTIQRLRERSQQYKETIERDLPQPEEFASGNQSDSETSSVMSDHDWRRRPQSPGASCGSHSTMSTTASTASCSSGNDCREGILTDEDAEALCALFPLPDFAPMPPPVTVCYHHHHHHHHHPSSMSAPTTTTHQTMQFASYSSSSFAPQSSYAFEDDNNDHYDDFPHFYPVDEVYTQ